MAKLPCLVAWQSPKTSGKIPGKAILWDFPDTPTADAKKTSDFDNHFQKSEGFFPLKITS